MNADVQSDMKESALSWQPAQLGKFVGLFWIMPLKRVE